MNRADPTERAELRLTWLVALGVACVGIYDVSGGVAPRGVLDLAPAPGLVIFLTGCLLSGVLATILASIGEHPHRSTLRSALLVTTIVPIGFTDPSYGALLVVIPIIDIRRRDDQPFRTWKVVGVLAIAAWLVLTEDTPSAGNGIETMLGLAIAILVVILLGDALRELDKRLVAEADFAKLAERNRLAAELHDGLGHHLLASSIQLQKAKALQERDPAASADAVDNASKAIAEAISETRLIVDSTRQDIPFAIEPSIRELARRIVPTETAMDIQISGDHDRLDTTTQLALYRVVQEALTNLVRHSEATSARIRSTASADSVVVAISDNGAGFNPDATKTPGGLGNMRRRVEELGGTFTIESALDGTSVTASVPR